MEKSYVFEKNIKGGLTITLDSFDLMLPTRNFSINYNMDRVIVPYKYALGMFVTPSALAQYNQGMFRVQNFDELVKAAVAQGVCAEEDFPEAAMNVAEIDKIVKSNKTSDIRKIITKGNPVDLNNLVTSARDNLDTLSQINKNLIEQKCGVELSIE